MRSPINIKEVQQLVRMITTLSFETTLPNFLCLKKNEKFPWTEEKNENNVGNTPILTWLIPSNHLLIYLSISDDTISKAIVQERDKEQRLIYTVRPRKRYQKIEKAALPYFQSNHVIVRTDLPIKQVLQKPNLVERMTG
ncbi:hypothetical protein CR513_21148, partial [Mucuna pruriens]